MAKPSSPVPGTARSKSNRGDQFADNARLPRNDEAAPLASENDSDESDYGTKPVSNSLLIVGPFIVAIVLLVGIEAVRHSHLL